MLFTVEQLELIRRLRLTGISADMVVKAFVELEKVEEMKTEATTNTHEIKNINNNNNQKEELKLRDLASYAPLLVHHLTSRNSPASTPPTPERISVQTVPQAAAHVSMSPALTPPALVSAGTSYEQVLCSGPPRPIRSQRTPMKEITTLDNPKELEEFMMQGEEGCIRDMKGFIVQYSLRQTTVAMMTGVSQPYISKLLNGNHRELSLRCRKNIYCWYLNCRRHPQKLAAFLADPASRLETNVDGELMPQRRERYVFRPIIIRMLEGFFAQTPFPDLSRRAEIATACNHVLQMDNKGVRLMPKEVVSPQVVANWFANKRKEIRRRSADKEIISNGGELKSSSCGSLVTDTVSVSSMSPQSRDDELGSRNTTPESMAAISPASPCPMPFDLTVATSQVSPSTSPMPVLTSATPIQNHHPAPIPPPMLDILAVAKSLGLNIGAFPPQVKPEPTFAANFLQSNPFLQLQLMGGNAAGNGPQNPPNLTIFGSEIGQK